MIIGKVTGSIVSTRKQDNLIGNKFMVIEPIGIMDGHFPGHFPPASPWS